MMWAVVESKSRVPVSHLCRTQGASLAPMCNAVGGRASRDGDARRCKRCERIAMTPMQRFEKNVDRDGGCWNWTGQLTGHGGYGTFRPDNSAPQERATAHRWYYEQVVGPVPDGLVLDHLCRNRACVNPDHLEPVTIRENVLRGETEPARNRTKTHCRYGHPLSGDNLVASSRGHRVCRTCAARRNREARA